jgi:hypothetical protein
MEKSYYGNCGNCIRGRKRKFDGKTVSMIKFMVAVFFGCLLILGLFFSCINWAHIVEHNELRTLDEYDKEMNI